MFSQQPSPRDLEADSRYLEDLWWVLQERTEGRQKLVPPGDDRLPRAEERRRGALPVRVGAIEEINVPGHVFHTGHEAASPLTAASADVFPEPATDDASLVPEVHHPLIRQELRIPLRPPIVPQHREPYRVHLELGRRVLLENRLDLTGPRDALRSRRGDQQDDAGNALILVELHAELLEVAEVRQGGRRLRTREAGLGPT